MSVSSIELHDPFFVFVVIFWRILAVSFCLFLVSEGVYFFISVSLSNAACHPLCPSSLLDIRELGRHHALRPRREGWKNVCVSHSVWCWGEYGFISALFLTMNTQVTAGIVESNTGHNYAL